MNIRKKRISEMVDLLLNKASVSGPAVSLEKIAETLNLKVGYESFDDNKCGCLIRKGNTGLIEINKDHPETRQRFTFAHELGHYMMHGTTEGFVDNDTCVFLRDKDADQNDTQEIEANYFAAELLMPEKFIGADLKNNLVSNEFIENISKKYNVSTQAMPIRLFNLGYPITG